MLLQSSHSTSMNSVLIDYQIYDMFSMHIWDNQKLGKYFRYVIMRFIRTQKDIKRVPLFHDRTLYNG